MPAVASRMSPMKVSAASAAVAASVIFGHACAAMPTIRRRAMMSISTSIFASTLADHGTPSEREAVVGDVDLALLVVAHPVGDGDEVDGDAGRAHVAQRLHHAHVVGPIPR